MSLLKLQCIGFCGKDATIGTANGRQVINWSIAYSEKYKNAQGVEINKTTWIECAYWTEKTLVATYIKKGTQVYVEGVPSVHMYTNNQGQQSATLKLQVFSIQLLGSKPEGSQAQQQQPQSEGQSSYSANGSQEMDGLPF